MPVPISWHLSKHGIFILKRPVGTFYTQGLTLTPRVKNLGLHGLYFWTPNRANITWVIIQIFVYSVKIVRQIHMKLVF